MRRATEADARALAAHEPPGADVAASHLRAQERGEAIFLVAVAERSDAEERLGSGVLVLGEVPELRHLHVLPQARGAGVGSALTAAAEQEARALGATEIAMGVGDDNPRARALYERLGYLATGRISTTTYEYVDDDGVRRTATETDEELRKPLR